MERIEAALAQQPNPQVTFQAAEEGLATRVLIGGSHAFLVTAIDIDATAGESTKVVAREAGRRLEAAIVELRETQTPRYLGQAALWAVLATLAYVLALRVFFVFTRWSDGRLSQAAARRAGDIEISGVKLIQPDNVARYGHAMFVAFNWAVAILLTVTWLAAVLRLFPFTRPWGEDLGGHLLEIVRQFSVAAVNALPGCSSLSSSFSWLDSSTRSQARSSGASSAAAWRWAGSTRTPRAPRAASSASASGSSPSRWPTPTCPARRPKPSRGSPSSWASCFRSVGPVSWARPSTG
jgi:hypothetical protein